MTRSLSAPGGQRMIDSVKGDTAGAACEIAEKTVLLILSAWPLRL